MEIDERIISKAIIDRFYHKLMDHLEVDVAIVGGGPAGLVAGYYLARAGRKIALYERKLSVGGGMWGGGMMFNEIVVQEAALDILDDFGIRHFPYEGGHHSAGSIGVLLNRNYGQHAAVMAGFAEARGGIVVTLDADLQNPPEEMPRLVEAIEQGFDVVGSVRVPRCDTFFRRIASSIVNKVAQKATGVIMHDYGCMLRAYRRNIVDAMLTCQERSTFIPVLANSFAKNTKEIEVHHESRSSGDSKYSLWKLINLQFDLLTSMTTFPLRLLTVFGGAISLLGITFGIFILVMRLVYGPQWAAEGVFTLFAVLFILTGGQFIAMGLLGEYIGRVYHDVRGRPRYFVQQVVGRGDSEHETRSKKSQEAIV